MILLENEREMRALSDGTTETPGVSVVIPLYNKGKYVERALSSVVNQSFPPLEIIVVDDGSGDDGPEKVHSFGDPRIVLVRQENRGPGAARNAGLAKARGKYVAFIDADDEWLPSFLEAGIAFLENSSANISAVWTGYYRHPSMRKNNEGLEELSGVYEISAKDRISVIQNLVRFVSACTGIMRTAVARRWDGFFEQYKCLMGEDRHLFLKILFNEKIGIVPEHLAIYHIEASGLCHGKGDGPGHIPPYLRDSTQVLDACPESTRYLLKQLLTLLALEKAQALAYMGRGREAKELVNRFSENTSVNRKGFLYTRLLIRAAPLLPSVRWCWRCMRKLTKLGASKRLCSPTEVPLGKKA